MKHHSSKRSTYSSVGADLIEAFTELRDTIERGGRLEKQFTVRTIEIVDPQRSGARPSLRRGRRSRTSRAA